MAKRDLLSGLKKDTRTPNSDDARSQTDILPASATLRLNNKPEKDAKRRRRHVATVILLAILAVLALGLGLGLGLGLRDSESKRSLVSGHGQTRKPNVLVIMSDDQDLLLDSMSVMPNVNKYLGEQGVRYENHYCTVAWCCPSRVNFFTGRAAHNTNVTNVRPPYGGWQKFSKEGLNHNWLPVWINETGISTYYVGKLLNGYSHKNLAEPEHPKGWTQSRHVTIVVNQGALLTTVSFLLAPWTYNYYHSHWTSGYTDSITPFPGIHTTDVTQSKALAMIDQAADSKEQFFMMVAPVAPHQQEGNGNILPPVPNQWKGVFNDRAAPRTENFNPDKPSGASWVHAQPKLDREELHTCDKTYFHRLGNIAAIDDMVYAFIKRLESHGILDNTYIIYTSDNGFHIGNHRLLPGKRCPYEEDVNIPFLIRGPDVPQGINSSLTNSHTDVAPTILKMLGVPSRDDFDGAPIAYTKDQLTKTTKYEIVQVEFWGSDSHSPLGAVMRPYFNNTYKALRMISEDYNLYYSTWCSGEHEFYDMKGDSQQMHNLLRAGAQPTSSTWYGRSLKHLINRMDAVLMVTKSCKQDSCRNPWGVIFPDGSVTSLKESMASHYDEFFTNQPRVQFDACTPGYLEYAEHPFNVDIFRAGSQQVLS